MSDSTLSTFSTCGKYFSSFGADGKLRIWDTLSNTLKQEYTPNMHLTSPITSLKWIKLSNPVSSGVHFIKLITLSTLPKLKTLPEAGIVKPLVAVACDQPIR